MGTHPKRLTKSVIDALTAKYVAYIVYCPALSGFGVRTMPTGLKVYIVRYRTRAGIQRLHTIARVTDMSLDAARSEAARLLSEARLGRDPSDEKKTVRASKRLCEVWESFHSECKAYKKPKTAEFYETQFRVHLSHRFGKMHINSITSDDIKAFMIDYSHKKATANNCLQTLKVILNYAKVENNPCNEVKMYRIERVPRVLSTVELQRINAELDNFTFQFRLLCKLLILTGARLREWMCAETDWVDFELKALILPTSKTGAKVINLSDDAVNLLDGCKSRKYVIMESWGNAPIKWPNTSLRKLRAATGIKDLKFKDFRSTYASRSSRAGLTIAEIAALLGHKQLRTTGRYIGTYNDNDGRNPVEIAASAMK